MADKGMTDFLSYNIYLTRWKEKEVKGPGSSAVTSAWRRLFSLFPSARRLTSASTTRRKTTP